VRFVFRRSELAALDVEDFAAGRRCHNFDTVPAADAKMQTPPGRVSQSQINVSAPLD
jgi:hypothetical protein